MSKTKPMLRIYLTVEDRDGTSKTDDNCEETNKEAGEHSWMFSVSKRGTEANGSKNIK